MTRGDNHNIRCPHCGKTNHYPVDMGCRFDLGTSFQFVKPCALCGEMVYYEAHWQISLEAWRNTEERRRDIG